MMAGPEAEPGSKGFEELEELAQEGEEEEEEEESSGRAGNSRKGRDLNSNSPAGLKSRLGAGGKRVRRNNTDVKRRKELVIADLLVELRSEIDELRAAVGDFHLFDAARQ